MLLLFFFLLFEFRLDPKKKKRTRVAKMYLYINRTAVVPGVGVRQWPMIIPVILVIRLQFIVVRVIVFVGGGGRRCDRSVIVDRLIGGHGPGPGRSFVTTTGRRNGRLGYRRRDGQQ